MLVVSIIGMGTRSESIGMTWARGRTTAVSSATWRISDRRISGIRNPPSDGTSEPKEFWIFSAASRFRFSVSEFRRVSYFGQTAWKNSAVDVN